MGDTHTKKTIGKRVASTCSKTTVVVRDGVTSHSGFIKKMSKSLRTTFWTSWPSPCASSTLAKGGMLHPRTSSKPGPDTKFLARSLTCSCLANVLSSSLPDLSRQLTSAVRDLLVLFNNESLRKTSSKGAPPHRFNCSVEFSGSSPGYSQLSS